MTLLIQSFFQWSHLCESVVCVDTLVPTVLRGDPTPLKADC